MTQPVTTSSPPVVELARQQFATEGLELPYIPAGWDARLHQRNAWVYGTRLDTPIPYHLQWFMDEVATQPVSDYLLFGHDGHGINSYAMHNYLVRPWLGLFDQCAWGGAMMDNETALMMVRSHFNHSRIIAELAEEAYQKALFPQGESLLVITSDIYGPRWGFFKQGSQPFSEISFHTEHTGLEILLDVRLMLHRLLPPD